MNPLLRRFRGLFLFLALATSFGFAFAAQCLGTTRAGQPCKNQGDTSGYCRFHNPGVTKCAARTKDGSPCRNPPSGGTIYCHVHKK